MAKTLRNPATWCIPLFAVQETVKVASAQAQAKRAIATALSLVPLENGQLRTAIREVALAAECRGMWSVLFNKNAVSPAPTFEGEVCHG